MGPEVDDSDSDWYGECNEEMYGEGEDNTYKTDFVGNDKFDDVVLESDVSEDEGNNVRCTWPSAIESDHDVQRNFGIHDCSCSLGGKIDVRWPIGDDTNFENDNYNCIFAIEREELKQAVGNKHISKN